MFSTPNTAPVGSPRELLKGGSALNARYRYDEPSTRTRSGRVFMRGQLPSIVYVGGGGGGIAPFSFLVASFGSEGETSGAGVGGAGCESVVCGELGPPVGSGAG